MEFKRFGALVMAVLLVAVFTAAILGRASWMAFWVLAVLTAGYAWYIKR